MSDTPDLLVPDRRIVSIEDAARDREKNKPRATGSMNDFVTRKEFMAIIDKVMNGVGEASAAVGQQVYDAVAEEHAEKFAIIEETVMRQVSELLERRSLRGRARATWLRLRERFGPARPAPDIRLVDAVEALDPNVAERAKAELATIASDAVVEVYDQTPEWEGK